MNKLKVLILVGIANLCQHLIDKLLMISTWAVGKCCPEELKPNVSVQECDHSLITSKEQFLTVFSEHGPTPSEPIPEAPEHRTPDLDFQLPLIPLEGHYQLSDEAYDRFEQQLNDHPLSQNKTLEEFLKNKPRWS